MKKTKCSKTGFVFGAALLGTLAGCTSYVDRPHHARVYSEPQPALYVETGGVVQDGYVYYPRYQVYYSSNRRQYIYRDGRSWVSRPAPPLVSVDVLFASPSVSLDFHDSPEIHHASVVRQYPKKWKPPGWNPNHGKGNDRGDRT